MTEIKNRVEKIGLCLFDCGFLGSTPDSIIFTTDDDKGVLEVRCPYKYRDFRIDEMLKLELKDKEEKKAFFLKADGTVNERHCYWHQVQAEMYATSVSWCDFVVWILKDIKVIRVLVDKDWGSKKHSQVG